MTSVMDNDEYNDPFQRLQRRMEKELRRKGESRPDERAGTDPAGEDRLIEFAYERREDADVEEGRNRG